ncbi:acylphosphatase [Virgibacillus necropolis]|uniref:acylphosphatase n=1 Tax=Virgibacillus necropolis TaxID=163877 RepID=UPI0038501363
MVKSIIVSGIVQGVGFRYATKQSADVLNLKGWVKNNADGTVQIHVDGESDQIQKFIIAIKNNPTQFAQVNHIHVTELDNKETYQDFTIK